MPFISSLVELIDREDILSLSSGAGILVMNASPFHATLEQIDILPSAITLSLIHPLLNLSPDVNQALVAVENNHHREKRRIVYTWNKGERIYKTNDCVFCEIINGKRKSSVVYESQSSIAILDYTQVNPGHTLILPKQHWASFFEIPPVVRNEMMHTTEIIYRALLKAGVNMEGYHLLLNNGFEAHQEVLHSHLHIVPRYTGDNVQIQWSGEFRKRKPAEPYALADRLKQFLHAK